MRKLSLLVLLLVASAPSPVAAQWTRVPGAGCTGVPILFGIRGQPRLGQTVGASIRCRRNVETPFMMTGTPVPRLIAVRPPIVCTQRACNLALLPLLVVQARPGATASIALRIPNNRALIGGKLRFQGVCRQPRPICVTLSGAIEMTVQR